MKLLRKFSKKIIKLNQIFMQSFIKKIVYKSKTLKVINCCFKEDYQRLLKNDQNN